MIGLFNLSARALSNYSLSSSRCFSRTAFTPPLELRGRVSSSALSLLLGSPGSPHSNFSTIPTNYSRTSYWEERIKNTGRYLELKSDDLKYLGSLSKWIKNNGIDVESISFPYEKLEKNDVKKLLKVLSKSHPELPGFGIANKNPHAFFCNAFFCNFEIISNPDLKTIKEMGCEMEKEDPSFWGIDFENISLVDEGHLDVIADQIVTLSKTRFISLILSKNYWA